MYYNNMTYVISGREGAMLNSQDSPGGGGDIPFPEPELSPSEDLEVRIFNGQKSAIPPPRNSIMSPWSYRNSSRRKTSEFNAERGYDEV